MRFSSYLKVLTLIHTALLIGLFVFSAVAYFTNPDFKTGLDSKDIFIYLVPMVAILGYFGSTFLFQKFLRDIPSEDPVEQKLNKYQSVTIITYAMIEGATICALVGYYLQGNIMHMVIALTLVAYLYSQRPTKKKIFNDLKISSQQKRELQNQK